LLLELEESFLELVGSVFDITGALTRSEPPVEAVEQSLIEELYRLPCKR